MSDAMEAEFDTVAGWTVDAVAAVGRTAAVPAGCRGSGGPAVLAWLAEAFGDAVRGQVLDAGAGVGGPAGWLHAHYGARAVCVDPMPAAVRAARTLFGLPAVVGDAAALPFTAGTFDAAWALGVLSTVDDVPSAVGELVRVLRPGGALGLLVYTAEGPVTDPPEGNDFPSPEGLRDVLRSAGLELTAVVDGSAMTAEPPSWAEPADRVQRWIGDAHGDDPRWQESQEQAGRMGRLLADGEVRPLLVAART